MLSFNGACKSVRLKEGEGIARQARDIDIHVHQRNAPATILGQMFSAVLEMRKDPQIRCCLALEERERDHLSVAD